MGIRGKGSLDRLRTIWTPEMDRYLIDQMLEQLKKGNRFDDHVFSKTAWMSMNSSFNEKFKFDYEMDVLKNRHKTLRNVFKAVKNLLNQKGFSWDAARQMVVAESKIWDKYIKVNPDVRPYRLRSLPCYDDLCVIYGDHLAGKMGYSLPETSSHLGEDEERLAARLEHGEEGTVEAVHEIALGEECVSLPLEMMDASESTPIATTNPPYGRNRMYWQPPMDQFFIDLMVEQVRNGNQIGGVFCKQAWIEMIALFNAKFGSSYDVDILKNRLKTLRRQYNVIKNILQLDGFAWDYERQMVTADDSVWQDYIKGHKDARQFMTRPVPYYKDLCSICNSSYPDERDCVALQCSEPENVVQEVKPVQAAKSSQSPVASISSEGEIGYLLDPACLDSNTGSNANNKRQLENKSSSIHSKKSRSEYDSMASALREMASAVSSLTEKKDDENSNPISIESVVTAVQTLPYMDEEFILDACDFLEDEIKAKTFMALDVKLRKKWLSRKLRPPQ
ncbi:two-component response regulator ARR2-like [Hibiscus syriacus]|uniref:Two-component response regulator ARR2-like n=1 Tax=Hibiscus syriacus TaxID=106335 RepID=A0A6A3AGL2_HIBSY|nr:L10-interacting MYB domain-containing protein-like [Hibiscus syriacus]KAE8701999.1 two-component response regulator ARR2-like [Hibiscus syriacus]